MTELGSSKFPRRWPLTPPHTLKRLVLLCTCHVHTDQGRGHFVCVLCRVGKDKAFCNRPEQPVLSWCVWAPFPRKPGTWPWSEREQNSPFIVRDWLGEDKCRSLLPRCEKAFSSVSMCVEWGLAEGDGVEEPTTDFFKGLLTFSILAFCLSTRRKIIYDVLFGVTWKWTGNWGGR